ncbi:MAG: YihY/virulence factor BrkB family protein [Ferruginibacter sp.]
MSWINWKGIKQVFKDSATGFGNHKLTKLSGSLAYSTVFSMAPLLIVIISLCSIFLGKEAVEGKVYEQLAGFIGSDTAVQLQQIIKNATVNGKSNIAVVIGFVTLLIGSTAVFSEIQDSINTIWGVKPKPKKGWLKILKNRFLSFSIIVALVFLLLVSLAVSSVIDVFGNHLKHNFPNLTVVTLYIINNIITLCITTLIFAVIFKVLPDAIIKWKDIFIGALCTALFFMLGKFAISLYISQTKIGTTYGAAGSLVILLVWIYYSSLILFVGAEITKAYALIFGSSIYPKHYAVATKTVELESPTG